MSKYMPEFKNTGEQAERLMGYYNISDEQYDSLGAFAIRALWERMQPVYDIAPDLLIQLKKLISREELEALNAGQEETPWLDSARAIVAKAST